MSHRCRRSWLLAWSTAVVLAGCAGEPAPKREWTPADHGQPRDPAPERQPQQAEPNESPEVATARAARALFSTSCASCHGRDGRGQGEGRPPGATLPDFTNATFQDSRTDAQLALVIREGRGMMPGFSKQLTEPGIAALVQYVRSLAAGATDAGARGDTR